MHFTHHDWRQFSIELEFINTGDKYVRVMTKALAPMDSLSLSPCSPMARLASQYGEKKAGLRIRLNSGPFYAKRTRSRSSSGTERLYILAGHTP